MRGGTRVPFIISWPERIKPGVSDALVCQIDLVSSFATLLNQKIPSGQAADSEDILDTFLGKSPKGREVLIQEGYSNLAILKGDWKYIPAHRKQEPELYNIKTDISEKQNVIRQFPEKAKELADLLQAQSQ